MGAADETPIGFVPAKGAIDVTGLSGVEKNMEELLKVDKKEWLDECVLIAEHQATFGNRLPREIALQFKNLKVRLNK
jgi:phosphoenolpyruvate carboxykinase (GTP)